MSVGVRAGVRAGGRAGGCECECEGACGRVGVPAFLQLKPVLRLSSPQKAARLSAPRSRTGAGDQYFNRSGVEVHARCRSDHILNVVCPHVRSKLIDFFKK